MDDTSAPWRALEEPAPSGGPNAAGPPGAPSAGGAPALTTRSLGTVAALAAAVALAVAAAWLVLGSGHGSVVVDPRPGGSDPGRVSAGRSSVAGDGDLVIDVQGAVARPGVVHVPAGSRVGDAIAAAGGFSARVAADRVGTSLNLAALVRDGDQIRVPSRDDPASGPTAAGGSSGAPTDGPIDLNHATAEQLDGLPGIGPATAAKIIAAREEQPFATIDDLRTRKILGAATFEKVKALVVVR